MEFLNRFLNKVETIPEQLAVSNCTGNDLTYAELEQLSGRVYRYLKAHGIGREDFVFLSLPRGAETVAAIIGVWRAGAAFVVAEENLPAERADYIRKDCGCILTLDRNNWQEILDCTPLSGYEYASEHDAAFAVYTSGSTGDPKGVLHEYGNIDLIYRSIYKYGESLLADTRFAMIAPMNFVVFLISVVCLLECGSQLFIVPLSLAKNPKEMAGVFVSRQLDALFCAPSVLSFFRRIPTLKAAYIGSEPARGIWSEDPGFSIYNGYCMSESGFFPLIARLDKPNEIAPVGQPCFELNVTLRDEDGVPVRDGEEGEICFDAPYVRGYIGLPEESARAFVNGEFRTGDLGRRFPDGEYVITGRIDDMINISGNRVEPAEVESSFQRVTGIRDVAARGFAGSDSDYICLYYTGDPEMSDAEIRRRMAGYVPDYMIPSVLVQMDALPRTQSGKISRRMLPEPAMAADPAGYIAPSGDTEGLLCAAMAEVLHLERVGAEDDFYRLGASSITSMALLQRCGLPGLTINHIFRGRTPRAIASLYLAEQGTSSEVSSALMHKAGASRFYPLTQSQLGLYYECLKHEGELVYHNPLLCRFTEEVDMERLRLAVAETISAHPVLRAQILTGEDGLPGMVYRDAWEEEAFCTIETMTQAEFEALRPHLIRPFVLDGGELCRFRLIETGTARYMFADFHHIISDGTSINILAEDIGRAYRGEGVLPEEYTAFDAALQEGFERDTEAYRKAEEWYRDYLSDVEGTSLPPGDLTGRPEGDTDRDDNAVPGEYTEAMDIGTGEVEGILS